MGDVVKVAHLFAGGGYGGIECLCRNYVADSSCEHVILVLWGDGPVLQEIQDRGIRVIYLNLSSANIISGYRKVAGICEKEHINVVVAEHEAILSHIILMQLKLFKRNIKTVAYAHCNASLMIRDNEKNGLAVRKFIISHSLNAADKVVCISKDVAGSVIDRLNTSRERVEVVYNGVKLVKNTLPEKNEAVHKLIYVGRLVEEKGVQTIIKAIENLDDNYHLTIVGDGPYRTELEQLCAGFEQRVTFCGFREDVSAYLCDSMVFVHVPDCDEGFGITVVEAMSAGNICIAGDRGALSEVININNGFLIASSDVEKLSATIKYIFEDMPIEDRKKMIRCAKMTAEEFSLEKYVERMDLLYSEL